MDDGLARYAIGLGLLGMLALGAVFMTVRRGVLPKHGSVIGRFLVLYALGVFVQVMHFLEEWSTGFAEAFPAVFEYEPMSETFFTVFNLAWISVWIASALGVAAGWRVAYFPVWFFALAACANGVGHPLIAFVIADYFPGLWTALVLGAVGAVLLRILLRNTPVLATRPEAGSGVTETTR